MATINPNSGPTSMAGIMSLVQRSNTQGEKARIQTGQAINANRIEMADKARAEIEKQEALLREQQAARQDHVEEDPPIWDYLPGVETHKQKTEAMDADIESTHQQIAGDEVALEASRELAKQALELMKSGLDGRTEVDNSTNEMQREVDAAQSSIQRGLRA